MSQAPVVGTEELATLLARRWAIDVNTGTAAAPVWTRIMGVRSVNPTVDATMQDDDDYDSDGWGRQTKTMQRWSLEITVRRGEGIDTGAFDLGQEALRLASDQFGADGLVRVRWYDRNGLPEAYSGVGSVAWAYSGGGADSLEEATVTVSGQGVRTPIANPVAPAETP